MLLQSSVVESALVEFVDGAVAALPRIITGIVFLACATVLVKVIMFVVRAVLKRVFPHEEPLYRQFIATVVLVFLVFAVFLSFLSVVGLTAIAAALGTATGFLALGVSYALSGMLEDAVAGVYLLRDPDFNPGDRVDIDGTVGTVAAIELRKTRLSVDDDTLVQANADIEESWTRLGDGVSE